MQEVTEGEQFEMVSKCTHFLRIVMYIVTLLALYLLDLFYKRCVDITLVHL